MTQDLSDFADQLGEELRQAAYRRIETRERRARVRHWLVVSAIGLAVIGLLAVVVLVTL